MADVSLNVALQENLITMLAYDEQHGKTVSQLIDPALFEGDYRIIAERCVNYWRKFGEAPKNHVADLLDDIISDGSNRKAQTFKRILTSMYRLSDQINTKYVLDQLRSFTRMQRLKDTIIKSADRLNAKQEFAIEEIENMWQSLLRAESVDFDAGLRLHDTDRILSSLEMRADEFKTGVEVLDKHFIVPCRESVLLFLGASGRGKSWALVNCGKQALIQRKKVLHVTLEMGADEVALRYYQSLFSVTKREVESVKVPVLSINQYGRLDSIDFDTVKPEFSLRSEFVKDELDTRLEHMGKKVSNLIIKRFPPNTLTPRTLEAYLDTLAQVERFEPDLLLVDYLGIMKLDAKDVRGSLGRTYVDLRGLAITRNVAIVTAHQATREGAKQRQVRDVHVAEDWSLVGTGDQLVTISMTETEQRLGLGRLFVAKARGERDKFSVLFTHNYEMGQFGLESVMLTSDYWDQLKALDEETPDGDDDDQQYDDDDDEDLDA